MYDNPEQASEFWARYFKSGTTLLMSDKLDEAEKELKIAISIAEKHFHNDPRLAQSLNALALTYFKKNDFDFAEVTYLRAMEAAGQVFAMDDPQLLSYLNGLALCLLTNKKYARAEPLYSRSLPMAELVRGASHIEVAAILRNLGMCYENLQRLDDAANCYKRLADIYDSTKLADSTTIRMKLRKWAETKPEPAPEPEAPPASAAEPLSAETKMMSIEELKEFTKPKSNRPDLISSRVFDSQSFKKPDIPPPQARDQKGGIWNAIQGMIGGGEKRITGESARAAKPSKPPPMLAKANPVKPAPSPPGQAPSGGSMAGSTIAVNTSAQVPPGQAPSGGSMPGSTIAVNPPGQAARSPFAVNAPTPAPQSDTPKAAPAPIPPAAPAKPTATPALPPTPKDSPAASTAKPAPPPATRQAPKVSSVAQTPRQTPPPKAAATMEDARKLSQSSSQSAGETRQGVAEDEREQLVGTTLDNRYRLDAYIGAGGMSVVYRGTHLMMARAVAIKMMHSHLAEKDDVFQRFQQEARAASSLSHPNIVPAHDFGMTPDGLIYLVMDYVEGKNLEEVIKEVSQLPVSRCIDVFTQICGGLQYAHDNGLLHRDLKPSNIMLVKTAAKADVVKIVDFGLAKSMVGESENMKLTRTGEFVGSPLYMSPEQFRAQKLDGRSDIYSLALVAYECLTGKRAITGETYSEVVVQHFAETPLSFAAVRPDLKLPGKLEEVIFKALEKEPSKRYASVDEFGKALLAAV